MVPAVAALALAHQLSAGAQVGVYLDFENPPSPVALAVMRRQTADELNQLGYQVQWRLVAENQGKEAFENLAVVKFSGACAAQSFLRPTREILVLGTTAVSDGEVLPYSQIRCDEIRRVLPDVEFAADRQAGDSALGRAMSRVLSHELYHVLKGTTHHQPAGIAKAIQTSDELTSADLWF